MNRKLCKNSKNHYVVLNAASAVSFILPSIFCCFQQHCQKYTYRYIRSPKQSPNQISFKFQDHFVVVSVLVDGNRIY